MRFTKRGYRLMALLALIGFLTINGVAGWIESGMS